MNEILGSSIMRLRKENEMTQEQLANALGITYQAVSKWETGVSCPDIAMLPLLADLFGVSIDELFGRPARGVTPEAPKAGAAQGVPLPWPDDPGMLHAVLFAGHRLVGGDQEGEQLYSRKQIEFKYEGPALNIWSDFSVSCGDVQGSVKAGGDLSCGAVGGSVSAHGDVNCGGVGGDVGADGDVSCGGVEGSVSAHGDVSCSGVEGSVSAGGDVCCDNVKGDVNAGGDVSCDDVGGSVNAGGDVSCDDVGMGAFAAGGVRAGGGTGDLNASLSGLGARISDAVNRSIRYGLLFGKNRNAEIHPEHGGDEDDAED